MINKLIVISLLYTFGLFGSGMKPLWEEDPNFIKIRTIWLECSIIEMEYLVDKMKSDPQNINEYIHLLEVEIYQSKFSLGID